MEAVALATGAVLTAALVQITTYTVDPTSVPPGNFRRRKKKEQHEQRKGEERKGKKKK